MDLTPINEVLGLASSAVGLTGKAASTITAIKGLFEPGKMPDSAEASKLLNALASDLTAANVMNVQLSESLRTLSQQLQRQDEFENEKARYELFQTGQNDLVFKLKEEKANGQPIHFICPVCLNSGKEISFISGEGDFKRCQKDTNHIFRFKNTPIRQPTRASSGWV